MQVVSIPVIGQNCTILQIVDTPGCTPAAWQSVFQEARNELADISNSINIDEGQYGQCYPLRSDIFNAFWYTPLHRVNVVIVGQDPYPQALTLGDGSIGPRAVGLSFSVRRGDAIPSSLANIYKELQHSGMFGYRTLPDHGDLSAWCRQGVLLLNSCLTVRPGQPGSHGAVWSGFISRVLAAIAQVNPYCIFMLWGNQAREIKKLPGWSETFLRVEGVHPSGMNGNKFVGCNHFRIVNDTLKAQGKRPIVWKV